MTRFWRVVFHDYSRHVFNKRFLLGLLSVPIFIAVLIGAIYVLVALEMDTTPVGYVDHSGLLANPLPAPAPEPPDRPVPMIAFATEAEAQTALEAGELQCFYVLEADYLKTSRAQLVYIKPPRQLAGEQFSAFLVANLLASQPPEVAARVIDGSNITVRAADGSREMNANQWFNILTPMFGGITFLMAIFSGGGYLLQAVTEEKENRTVEIIVTSISPGKLMAGKVVGNIAVGFTQLIVWLAFAALAINVGKQNVELLRMIEIDAGYLLLTIAVMLPSFVFIGALMAAIGATVTNAQDGQQVVGLLTLPVWTPYYLITVIMTNPNGPLAVVLSLIPFTAPTTMSMRAGFAIIPTWQIVACLVILTLSALGALWLAGRAFRLGMLRYGKRLPLRELFRREAQAG